MKLEASNIKSINSLISDININDIINFQNVNISNLAEVSKLFNKNLKPIILNNSKFSDYISSVWMKTYVNI